VLNLSVSFKKIIVHGAEGNEKNNSITEKSLGPAINQFKKSLVLFLLCFDFMQSQVYKKREKDCTKKRLKTWIIRRLNSNEIASSI
jgi:hypothetical protein